MNEFKPIYRAIKKLTQGYSNFCIIKGRAGLGKSYNIRRFLDYLKADYVIATKSSEAYLYRLLYENNGKIIWLKDFSSLIRSLKGIDELKAATETEKERKITNYNYSDVQVDLPREFVFTGKIIMDCNEITNSFKGDIEALVSRAGNNFIDFSLSFDEVKSLMHKICTAKWQKEVTDYLISLYEFVGFNELNLRTQYHCFQTYLYSKKNNLDWKQEIKEELKNNRSKIRSIVYSIAGNKSIKSMELKKYLVRSGYCNTLRTASRKLNDWLELGELFKVSSSEHNFDVSLNPKH